jgi:hypothetical protein
MAAGPQVGMAPPPSPNGPAPLPTSPPAVSPAPATPSPTMQQGTDLTLRIVRDLITLAKMFPAASKDIADINNIMRTVGAKIQESAQVGEPAAPPSNG